MVLTDTHTHLYYETNDTKRAGLIQRCLNNNINRLFLPNVDSSSISLVINLAIEYPDLCFPMLGLHPCSVKENWEEELNTIHNAINENKIFAIGEIGIDLYWDKTFLDQQREAFKRQITWAKKLKLPIVIHCRDAFNEVYEILKAEQSEGLRGIFHCFGGTLEQANKIIELGFYLGIGGVVTYKNSGLDHVVKALNLNHLVLETDAPYLAPIPYRGKPNESSYLYIIAQKIAEIYNVDLEEIAEVTTRNSKLVFGV